jgi:hypothetical protein
MNVSFDEFGPVGGPAYSSDLFTIPGKLGRLCKGAPREDKRMKALQRRVLQMQIAQGNQKFEFPEIPQPLPAAPDPPPPGTTASDANDAERLARVQASKRKGVQSTLLASVANYRQLGGAPAPLG